jgi:hypothetical protein
MCYICDGKRDLRVIASVMTLLSSVDFDRARMVIMAEKIAVERIQEIIEDQGPDEDGGVWLDLSSLLPSEDDGTDAIKATMAISMVMEETLSKMDTIHNLYGPFVVPSVDHGSESADAFNSFIGQMFGAGGEHDEEDDEEQV